MMCIWILSIFLIIGICHGGEIAVHRSLHALQRHTRAIVDDSAIMAQIISECKLNTHEEDITSKLQNIFQQTKACLSRKMILLTKKKDYLNNFDKCTKDVLQETIRCLPEKHIYLPVVLKHYAKNMISLLYDNQDSLSIVNPCMQKVIQIDFRKDYIECVIDSQAQNDFSSVIPDSKKEFCRYFLPSHLCFPQMMKKYCVQTDGVKKVEEDYNAVGEDICDDP